MSWYQRLCDGGDGCAGDDEDDDEEEEEEDDFMEEPELTGAVLGELVVNIMDKIGLATENCVGIGWLQCHGFKSVWRISGNNSRGCTAG